MTGEEIYRGPAASGGLIETARNALALLLSSMFLAFAAYLTALAGVKFVGVFGGDGEVVEPLIKAINLGIIGLAIFELAASIHKEYAGRQCHDDVFLILRRGVARFVGMVCIALVLEGLIMVIKYSQLDLAGNLYYAVAIVASAALLLIALGVFLKFSEPAARPCDPSAA